LKGGDERLLVVSELVQNKTEGLTNESRRKGLFGSRAVQDTLVVGLGVRVCVCQEARKAVDDAQGLPQEDVCGGELLPDNIYLALQVLYRSPSTLSFITVFLNIITTTIITIIMIIIITILIIIIILNVVIIMIIIMIMIIIIVVIIIIIIIIFIFIIIFVFIILTMIIIITIFFFFFIIIATIPIIISLCLSSTS
jgi:hypothetical protein